MRSAIFPEMLEAGIEALIECEKRGHGAGDICVAVWLAMEAVREIREFRDPRASVH